MRRIAMIGLAMLVASCSITQTERGEAEVTFVYATGTRAELADAVDCLMPQRLRLTLTDENGNLQTAFTGEPVTLALGKWRVESSYRANGYIEFATGMYTAKAPHVTISEEVQIDHSTNTLALSASLDCIALVYSTNIVQSLTTDNGEDSNGGVSAQSVDTLGVTFVVARWNDYTLGVNVNPLDGKPYAKKTYKLGRGAVNVENGRYYYIDPEHITQIETLPTYGYTGWQEGEIEQ